MIDKPPTNIQFYQIRLKGHLDSQWATWFDGLNITLEEDGTTLLSGPVADQAALHGLLRKVRDLGMPIISVVPAQSNHSEQGEKINMNTTPAKKIDTKVLLSTLWIVVMINMLKADILSMNIPGAAEEVARTSASAGASIPQLMLVGAIMGQLGIAMIVLSRVLKYGINRWVNIIAAIITIAYIWGGMASYPHYIFIATVETLCLLLIIGFAWTWRNPES
jgi:hypothetical protein